MNQISSHFQKKLITTTVPALFIFLWSTGFISAKYGLPYTTPFTFLFIRMILTLIILGGIIFLVGAKWPRNRAMFFHLTISGLLIHTLYLGGVFASIKAGLLASICSIIVGLQPIVTTLFSLIFLGTSFTRLQLWGFLSGFVGITLVIFGDKIGQVSDLDTGITTTTLIFALLALLGISGGTLYQKKYCSSAPLLTGAFIQYTVTGISMGIEAYIFEPMEIRFSGEFILALSWLVLGLSIAAILLLLLMIREGEAAKVASLFYLTPPMTALESFFLFNEQLSKFTLLGMGFAAFGVFMVIYTPRKKRVL